MVIYQENGCSSALDFWFACTGLKMVSDDANYVTNLARMLYKRYVRGGEVVRLSTDVRHRIVERLRQKTVDVSIFDEAQVCKGKCFHYGSH